MCIAVPARVTSIESNSSGDRVANVEYGGTTRQVRLDFVPEVKSGDFVVVHVGFAVSRMSAGEAEEALAALDEMREIP